MTPTQLRAFAAVVRHNSVKAAAAALAVSEAAVSLHIGQLRNELGDRLFVRTASGLAFTPGGLRLASRAAEILGLQDRTVTEVRRAGAGRRQLCLAVSSLFAEHAAPGLIELFAGRADDLDVELSVHPAREFDALLRTRTVDVAIGPRPRDLGDVVRCTRFLNYQLVTVAGRDHPLTRIAPSVRELREQTWLLGPSAVEDAGLTPGILARIGVPEQRQRIFQSHAAALEEAKRGSGIAITVSFAVARDLASGDLRQISGRALTDTGVWHILSLTGASNTPVAEELTRFVTTPRAAQAMLRGTGVTAGRFRPAVHVTLWS